MEPNGIFLNRIFQTTEKTTKGKVDLEQKEGDLLIDNSQTKELLPAQMPFPQKNFAKSLKKLDDMTRSSSSTYVSHLSGRRLQDSQKPGGSTMMTMDWVEDAKNSSQSSQHSERHEQRRAYNNSVQQQQLRSKNKRPSSSSQKAGKNEERRGDEDAHYVNFEEDNNNNVYNQNNNNYSINTTTTATVVSSSSSVSPFVEDSVKTTKKSKSGVRRNSNLNKTFDKSCGQEDREEQGLFDKSKSTSSFTSPSLLTWKLPSFLCLPFTNNDANNSYLHLMNTSSKSSGILSLTSLILVVMAVLLASVPAPVMSVVSLYF